jgi:hypothetical protein
LGDDVGVGGAVVEEFVDAVAEFAREPGNLAAATARTRMSGKCRVLIEEWG